MRVQLALNVDDLERAIHYYSTVFGVGVNKREPGYANFVVQNPPLKLVLFEAPGAERLNHLGFEFFDDAPIEAMAERLEHAGLLTEHQQAEVCCYARQNKAISHDPQGLMWEWYRVLEDSPTFFESEAEGGAAPGQRAAAQPFPGELTACGSGGCC